MKQTQKILMLLFWSILLQAAVIYLIADVMDIDISIFSGASREARFLPMTLMILITLALVPLSLRLFKFRIVADDLIRRKEKALQKWGIIRLCMLEFLLIVNALLYYFFGFESSFGYLAVVVLLTMPFVYPSMTRCINETEPQVEPEESHQEEEEKQKEEEA